MYNYCFQKWTIFACSQWPLSLLEVTLFPQPLCSVIGFLIDHYYSLIPNILRCVLLSERIAAVANLEQKSRFTLRSPSMESQEQGAMAFEDCVALIAHGDHGEVHEVRLRDGSN